MSVGRSVHSHAGKPFVVWRGTVSSLRQMMDLLSARQCHTQRFGLMTLHVTCGISAACVQEEWVSSLATWRMRLPRRRTC